MTDNSAIDRYLLGRQPILDRDERVVGYELLFRAAGNPNIAVITDGSAATARVILNTLTGFGIQQIVGSHLGFFNVELDMLMGDALELLPKEAVVLELLEILETTDQMLERCIELKAQGFCFALDDHIFGPDYLKLYDIVDIVKVDLLKTPPSTLAEDLRRYGNYPFKLLAEKVETRQDFLACMDLGFHYFQGFYFAKPSVLEKKKIGVDGMVLLKLMRLLNDDAELHQIEEAFRSSPTLTYKLLLLVNSVAYPKRQKIRSVRHAIAMAGRKQIKRWIQLALFIAEDKRGIDNPLIDLGAVRAVFMEQLAELSPLFGGSVEAGEQAFMVGILSLLDALYDISMEQVATELALGPDVKAALVDRAGPFGILLHLAEAVEQADFDAAFSLIAALGIPEECVIQAQTCAYGWQTQALAGRS